MSIFIFIVVLAVLIFVHELGHFFVAKWSGVRVDEFGLGFPPKALSFKPEKSETTYTINWIPFGGFVKIFGENPDDESINGPDRERSFVHKSKLTQIGILGAGIVGNILLAWLLFSATYLFGVLTPVSDSTIGPITDSKIIITHVLQNSPAETAGIMSGDVLISLLGQNEALDGKTARVEDVKNFIAYNDGVEMIFGYERGGETGVATVVPVTGLVAEQSAIGIAFDRFGIEKLSFGQAIITGAQQTAVSLKAVAVGLAQFLFAVVTGNADFSQVAGPVGIAGLVGEMTKISFSTLLGFMAFISLNLAVINLIPFPALDGGRILFVIIEAIKRSPISPKIANAMNLVGFGLLLILMLIVTVSDVVKLF